MYSELDLPSEISLKSIPKACVQTLGESRDEIVWVRGKINWNCGSTLYSPAMFTHVSKLSGYSWHRKCYCVHSLFGHEGDIVIYVQCVCLMSEHKGDMVVPVKPVWTHKCLVQTHENKNPWWFMFGHIKVPTGQAWKDGSFVAHVWTHKCHV